MLSINEEFVFRKICGVNLLIPVRRNGISNDTLSLNETARMIFEECTKADSSQELAKLLAGKYVDVDKNEVCREMETYINDLITSGLLVER